MKKIIIIIMIISLILALCACSGITTSLDPQQISNVQNSSSSEINNDVSPTKQEGISAKELKVLLNSKRFDILNSYDKEAETGTIAIIESHMTFPYIYLENLGMMFIYPDETDEYNPLYIVVNEDTNISNINIKGAKPGMNFNEIIGILGTNQISKTWFATEDNVSYKLDFEEDGINYSFVSYDEQGNDTQLYISKD